MKTFSGTQVITMLVGLIVITALPLPLWIRMLLAGAWGWFSSDITDKAINFIKSVRQKF